jgi:formamidopyrimidine-DNA glycosylase
MPELPDITVYIEALEKRVLNRTLKRVRITSPFLLRTALPPISSAEGKKVVTLRRLGKRICMGMEGDVWLVLHLMIAGRLHWKEDPVKPSRVHLATFEFTNGTLTLTEAGTQKRASLHVVEGDAGVRNLDPGGVEIFEISLDQFSKIIQSENHTLKRALTDPGALSGIGNAYSDEILWRAQLSPIALTQKLSPEELERLFKATRDSY